MDGSGGRKAANYMYSNARPDGLTIGSLSGGVIALSILKEVGVMYDADKFTYLGSAESVSHQVIYTRRELGLDSLTSCAPRPAFGSAHSRWDTSLMSLPDCSLIS